MGQIKNIKLHIVTDIKVEMVKIKLDEDESVSSQEQLDTNTDTTTKEEETEEVDVTQPDDSDSDEEPEDVSLGESRKRAIEEQKLQKDITKNIREQKKKTLQDRESRNKEQRGGVKRVRKSFLPDQLDEQLLELVDEDVEVDIPDDAVTKPKERKNTKIVFSDGDDEGEEDYND